MPTTDSISISETQLYADKSVSQASQIGLSVLGKATAVWEGGEEEGY